MVSTLRKAIDRMKEWRNFRRAMIRVLDGTPQADVLALLGPPDGMESQNREDGIEPRWEYHDRLPDHIDFIVVFAGGAVRCCYTRDLPNPRRHRGFRQRGGPSQSG